VLLNASIEREWTIRIAEQKTGCLKML